jgi:hypothetical protein
MISHSKKVTTFEDYLSENSLPSNSVYVFDFDGVISSSFDDDIYSMDTWSGELELLKLARQKWSIQCSEMDVRYQRHLFYQQAASILKVEIEPGPVDALLRDLDPSSLIFVLTARSGYYAVARMRDFIDQIGLAPLEIFCVGRGTKNQQLDLICSEFNGREVIFFEDNMKHLEAMKRLPVTNLRGIHIDRKNAQPNLPTLQEHVKNTLTRALQHLD